MSTEKHGGPEVPPQPKNPEEQIKQAQRKHLEAMAAGMGTNPLTARLSTEGLLSVSRELDGLDYSKDRDQLDPKTVEKIEAIGKWYLFGSDQADQFKFTVGARVLAILKEGPEGGNVKSLRNFVGTLTDGSGIEKFDEVLNREE